jgi:hypothetical protein
MSSTIIVLIKNLKEAKFTLIDLFQLFEPVCSKERREERDLGRVLVSVGNRFVVEERHSEDLALLFPTVFDQESR